MLSGKRLNKNPSKILQGSFEILEGRSEVSFIQSVQFPTRNQKESLTILERSLKHLERSCRNSWQSLILLYSKILLKSPPTVATPKSYKLLQVATSGRARGSDQSLQRLQRLRRLRAWKRPVDEVAALQVGHGCRHLRGHVEEDDSIDLLTVGPS